MKTLKFYIAMLAVSISLVGGASNPNLWSGAKNPTFLQNWTFNLQGGLTSFYGDLSYYDKNFAGKLLHESNLAASGMVIKHFGSAFGLGGQFLYGGFHNESFNKMSFSTRIIEYNLQFRVNFIQLIAGYDTRFGMTGFAGIGQFLSKTNMYLTSDQGKEGFVIETGVPEFVYFIGGGFSYRIAPRISVMTELSIRQAQNDRLDDYTASNDFDYYSHLSVGISYHIKNFVKSPKGNDYPVQTDQSIYR